ncbi:MAG: matrixin family metalloprotease [Candidatus Acidiferrales bacterium]
MRVRRRAATSAMLIFLLLTLTPGVSGYSVDTTIAQGGGCPLPDRWNAAAGGISRQWSTALPAPSTIVTAVTRSESAELDEIEAAISDSFGAWTGVTGTTLNAAAYPASFAALGRTSAQNACTNDAESNVDGQNTICFDQSSAAFTSGVLSFTRTFTANSPGASVAAGPPAAFAGQILDADTLLRNDGQVKFATPAGLAAPAGVGAYDLESILTHELGHWMGLDHSAVIRSMMFPFSPPPGQFTGARPTAQAPDGPLADDDRTGLRAQYPDPNDAVDIGTIQGRLLPANPFSLAALSAPAAGQSVTGIFGAQVVAVDTATGSVVAGTIGGWSCSAGDTMAQFDGTFEIDRLPVGQSYVIYAEPLVGLAAPGAFANALQDLCANGALCTTPAANLNFNVRAMPGSQ